VGGLDNTRPSPCGALKPYVTIGGRQASMPYSMRRDEREHRRRGGGEGVRVIPALPRAAEGDGLLTSYVDVKQILNSFAREM
jgi:hypothetical protein